MSNFTQIHEFLAADSDTGSRLDRFVVSHCPDLSRARVQELIDSHLVLVNGQPSKPSHKLRVNDRVSVQPEPRPALAAAPESIPLDVLYEDADLIVINKPAGMTVHAGAGNPSGTLVNALLGRGQALSQSSDPLRPGIVHRLDKETSGVIVIAKNDFAHAKLSEAFRTRAIQKIYLALVHGGLPQKSGSIDLAISRDPNRRMRMTAKRLDAFSRAREARTDWRTLQAFHAPSGGDPATLVEIQLHTGRTHQIRVHFSAIKHPVVGDTLYGAPAQLRVGQTPLPALPRQFLHAAKLSFAHPRTAEKIEVRAPLAPELHQFLQTLAKATNASKIDAALEGYL